MKKILLMFIIIIAICMVIPSSVFAAEGALATGQPICKDENGDRCTDSVKVVKCTEDDYYYGGHGCQDEYTKRETCTWVEYQTEGHVCSDKKQVQITDWNTYVTKFYSKDENGVELYKKNNYPLSAGGLTSEKFMDTYPLYEEKDCEDDDFINGVKGCVNEYITGESTDCLEDDYAQNLYGCQDRYLVGDCTDDDRKNNRYGCTWRVEVNNSPYYCQDVDYQTGRYGCNFIRQYEDVELPDKVEKPEYNWVNVPIGLRIRLQNIWATVSLIVQILAIGCIVFAGLRYMFASADQKADIKQGLIYLAIGSGFIFGAITIINIVVKVVEDIT